VPLVDASFTSQLFWSTDDVLNFARVLVKDTQGGMDGQNLATDLPQTWQLLNLCYAKLQNWLEDTNVESTTYQEWFIGPLPASVNAGVDPTNICRLSYDGFFDGVETRWEQPTLPFDMDQPLTVWERPGGSVCAWREMQEKQGGFGPWAGSGPYRFWEFRQLGLYFPGSTQQNELKIRGIPALPLLGPQAMGAQQIPLVRAGEALAYMVAAEYAEIRNAGNAAMLRMKANEQLEIISNKAAKRSNQTQQRRRGYGFGRRRGWLL
jgi:hypothetical protein